MECTDTTKCDTTPQFAVNRTWLGIWATFVCCGILLLIPVMVACKQGSCTTVEEEDEADSFNCSTYDDVGNCQNAGCAWKSTTTSCRAMLVVQALLSLCTLVACCCCFFTLFNTSACQKPSWSLPTMLNVPGKFPGSIGKLFQLPCHNGRVAEDSASGRTICFIICGILLAAGICQFLLLRYAT